MKKDDADNQQPSSSFTREGSETKDYRSDSVIEHPTVSCLLCINSFGYSKQFKILDNHLFYTHNITRGEYLNMFPDAICVSDSYRQKFLGKTAWNKGRTKETDETVKRNALSVKKTMCEMSARGELVGWCKGLTKDINTSLQRIADKLSGENNPAYGKDPWNKGLTKETSSSVLKNALSMQRTRLEMSARGELVGWNKGLTKEVDERVRRGSERQRNTLMQHIIDGTIVPIHNVTYYKQGYRPDLDHFVRSTWEANVARVFRFLNVAYVYEPKRFVLYTVDNNAITYLPDFYLPLQNEYYEVKGYFDLLWLQKVNLLTQQHPEVMLYTLGELEYSYIKLHYSSLVDWETDDIVRPEIAISRRIAEMTVPPIFIR